MKQRPYLSLPPPAGLLVLASLDANARPGRRSPFSLRDSPPLPLTRRGPCLSGFCFPTLSHLFLKPSAVALRLSAIAAAGEAPASAAPAQADGKLYVGNLPWHVDSDMLGETFQQYGAVTQCDVRFRVWPHSRESEGGGEAPPSLSGPPLVGSPPLSRQRTHRHRPLGAPLLRRGQGGRPLRR